MEQKIYTIWNNKGGVGKTTLTYVLSTEYAIKYPKKNIVVLDMCPQTNVSEMLLGGNGKGIENLEKVFASGNTIASYIKERYKRSKFEKLGSELNKFIKPKDYNIHMPANLSLLCGDSDLDLCGKLLEYLSIAPEKNAWKNTRLILIDLVETFINHYKEKDKDIENVFFIDCNPSFTIYTELALLASNRMIIPCTSDGASIRGLNNIFKLIYGYNHDKNKESVFDGFHLKCKEFGLSLPKIHSVVQNKSRTHFKNASKAFQANINKTEENLTAFYELHPNFFIKKPIVFNIKDGNTLVSVLNFTGIALSNLNKSHYKVYGNKTQVATAQVETFKKDIDSLLCSL